MTDPKKIPTPEKALLKMSDLCARSEQCESDIRQKLYRMGLTSSQVQEVVGRLIGDKFIDNARYARSFTHDKVRFCAWGRNKIRLGLMAKRISSAIISEALESIDEAEYHEALKRVTKAKARGMDFSGPEGRENKLRLFRHILSRGFESDLASKAIKDFISDLRQ